MSFWWEGGIDASKVLLSICTLSFLTLTLSYFCKAWYSKYYNGPSVVPKGGEKRSRACSHTVSHPHSLTPSLCLQQRIPISEWHWSDSHYYNLSYSVFGQNYMDLITGPSTIYICFLFIWITKIKPHITNFQSFALGYDTSWQPDKLLLHVLPLIKLQLEGTKIPRISMVQHTVPFLIKYLALFMLTCSYDKAHHGNR